MAEPPLSTGAVQERLIVLVPLAVAVRPVGAPGATAATSESLTTAGTPLTPVVKDAASLPLMSWMAFVSSPVEGSV